MQDFNMEGLRENIAAYPAWKKENPKYYMVEIMKMSLLFMNDENLAGMDQLKYRYDELFSILCSNSSHEVIDEIMETLNAALALFNSSYEDVMLMLNEKNIPF